MISREEHELLAAEADAHDGLLSAEDLYHLMEMQAEQEAENAWLRAAESAGWEDEMLEQLERLRRGI